MSMGGFIYRAVLLAFIAPAAFATKPTPKPAPAPVTVNQPVAVAGAAAGAKSEADAKAASFSNSNAEGGDAKAASVATGGDAKATGGKAVATGGEGGSSDASSNSGGNALTVNENQVRQAPGLAQGSFAIVGCGFAANAGGSGAGGAGFLGLGFTPEQCYDFMLANAYCTAGATAACCEVLNSSKAGRRAAARGVRLPECRPPVADPAPQPQPPVIVTVPCCDKPDAPPPQECPPDRCFEKCERGCKAQCQGDAACEKRCEVTCKRRCDGVPPSPAGSAGGSCPAVEQSKPN
jgi:hypothetical protein